jgi:rSAM/selenodomain-associated transferase 1
VALLGLPYGDQALFVRRHNFNAIGGYRDLPLMEDVDFVRRVKRIGGLLHARSAVVTSARRWRSDGWFRRSAQNGTLATRYLLGVSPAQLAQRYFKRKAAAVVVMGRAPWTGGKTRLAVGTDEEGHAALRCALFLDTLDVVRSVTGVEHIIACEPSSACEQMRGFVGPEVDVLAQRGDDLGQRLTHVFDDVFRLGVESIVVVGSDLPDLPVRVVEEALTVLSARDDTVVIGPAADGGYYLIGMNRHHPELFQRIQWSSERVLDQTLSAAKVENLRVVLLQQWSDVDAPSDLSRFAAHEMTAVAVRTRAWRVEHLSRP